MATSVWAIAGVVLLAVLVGASLPVLSQLRTTLRAAERFFESTGARADRCLEEVTSAAARAGEANRSSGRLVTALAAAAVPAVVAALDALAGPAPEVGAGIEAEKDGEGAGGREVPS